MPQLKYKDVLRLGSDLLHFGKSLFSKLHTSYATAVSRQSHLFVYGLVCLEDVPL